MLLYDAELSRVEQTIIRQAKLSGMPVPDYIREKPVLRPGLEIYVEAFADLASERAGGMAAMPIPWSAINAYAAANEFTGILYDELLYFIRAIDNAKLEKAGAF